MLQKYCKKSIGTCIFTVFKLDYTNSFMLHVTVTLFFVEKNIQKPNCNVARKKPFDYILHVKLHNLNTITYEFVISAHARYIFRKRHFKNNIYLRPL